MQLPVERGDQPDVLVGDHQPDPANDEHFGRPGVTKGEQAAFPMARVLAVAEFGTHAIFAAKVGSFAECLDPPILIW